MAYQPRADRVTPGDHIRVTPEEAPVIPAMLYAFAPLHKFAFGMATGVAGALLMAAVTVAGLLVPGASQLPLYLLEQYFEGYSVSWAGVAIGAAWGFVVAFVGGWFAAFCRNLSLAISAFIIRTRAEFENTREFLDHI
ncbi:MAG: hypothetical protein HUU26_09955 [Gemmatimonadaceae bacterium]|nr:hypothetical protein [Gemmatimonadaceae bacterium]